MLSLRGYLRFVGIAWSVSPALFIGAAVGVLATALAPLASVTAIGAVIGQVPRIAADGLDSPAGQLALWWTFAAGGFFLLQSVAGAGQAAATRALGERVDVRLQSNLMGAVMTPPGVSHVEEPRTVDLIAVGRDTFRAGARRPGRLATMLSGLVAGRLTILGSCVIVGRFQLILGVLLAAAALCAAREEKLASRKEAQQHHGSTETARRTEYYYELGVTPPAAKEVRIFGLSSFLIERFQVTWRRSMSEVLAPTGRRPLLAAIALGVVVLFGLGWAVRDAMAGRIGAAEAAVFAQALLVGLGGVRQAAWTGLQSELALATMRRFEEAVSAVQPPHAVSPRAALPARDMPRVGIKFEGVTFAYPNAKNEVLRDLDLVVPAGRSLAIVGANGAGKTTLIKLLCRLYEPTSGRITVDGVDLAVLDLNEWRNRVAAVFQDSTQFPFTARENVEIGRPTAKDDPGGVDRAAAAADALEMFAGLPAGWDTPLSTEFSGGVDLSGGQWQKVGLARALFAVGNGASVLILDEPAAHLDARAEARLYERFLAMTEGLTTIVISHRFSTVRQASSIAVLADGQVAEQGTHEELIARSGAYAEMFTLQAARFADRTPTTPGGAVRER